MKTCIIVGGGPSIKEGIEVGLWDKIKEKEIWSLNYAFMTMPYLPTRELWIDLMFFKDNIVALQNLYSKGVSCHAKSHRLYVNIPEIEQYVTTREPKEFDEKMFLGQNGLCGFFALSIAIKEEYDTVYLLGYDYGTVNPDDKFTHYYQNTLKTNSVGIAHPELYRQGGDLHPFIDDFVLYLAPNIKTKIYNVSIPSNITYFEKLNWQEFFNKINEMPKV
jgi:hypothetical protein